jgi:hypothetical protein
MDDLTSVRLPPGFEVASDIIRAALKSCEQRQVCQDVVLAVLLAEFLPRLVNVYGPTGVTAILAQIGQSIEQGSVGAQLRQ